MTTSFSPGQASAGPAPGVSSAADGSRPRGKVLPRLGVVGTATVAAAAAWTLVDPVAGIDLVVRSGASDRTIGLPAMVVTVLVVGLAGVGLLALLERFTRRAGRIWTVVAALVLLLSFLGPLGALTAAAGWALAATHLVVGGILLAGLARTAQTASIVGVAGGR